MLKWIALRSSGVFKSVAEAKTNADAHVYWAMQFICRQCTVQLRHLVWKLARWQSGVYCLGHFIACSQRTIWNVRLKSTLGFINTVTWKWIWAQQLFQGHLWKYQKYQSMWFMYVHILGVQKLFLDEDVCIYWILQMIDWWMFLSLESWLVLCLARPATHHSNAECHFVVK